MFDLTAHMIKERMFAAGGLTLKSFDAWMETLDEIRALPETAFCPFGERVDVEWR